MNGASGNLALAMISNRANLAAARYLAASGQEEVPAVKAERLMCVK